MDSLIKIADQARQTGHEDQLASAQLVLEEVRTLRSIAIGSKVLTDGTSVQLMGLKGIELLDAYLHEYGLILPATGWELGPTLGATEATREDWQKAEGRRVENGQWRGAFDSGEGRILLPGLKCFEDWPNHGKTEPAEKNPAGRAPI